MAKKDWYIQRVIAKNNFVKKNRNLCKKAFDKSSDYKTKEGLKLIEKARKELNYKNTSASSQIYWTLYCEYLNQTKNEKSIN